MIKNIMVIGCGPHFRAVYAKTIIGLVRKGKLHLRVLVDLEEAKDTVKNFLAAEKLSSVEQVFLPKSLALNAKYVGTVLSENTFNNIDAALICTEARAHKMYIYWALDNGMHVFVDKPLTVYEDSGSDLVEDFRQIEALAVRSSRKVYISCQRRYHHGYQYVRRYISKFIQKNLSPITYVDIHFAGGSWVMPNEVLQRNSHPFHYGYGVLFHSGYHYVDLLVSLAALNRSLFGDFEEQFVLQSLSRSIVDFNSILPKKLYAVLTNYKRLETCKEQFVPGKYGEIELMCIGKFLCGNMDVVGFNLTITEASVCKRICALRPADTYGGRGRLRQERVIIHLGPLMSVHISSLPKRKVSTQVAHEDFNIEIFTHPSVGLPSYQLIDRLQLSSMYEDLPLKDSMNKLARTQQLQRFLAGKTTLTDYSSHANSILFMQKLAKQLY